MTEVTVNSVSIEIARRMARDPRHYTLAEMMAVWRGVMGDFTPEARLAISGLAKAIDQKVSKAYRKDEGSFEC